MYDRAQMSDRGIEADPRYQTVNHVAAEGRISTTARIGPVSPPEETAPMTSGLVSSTENLADICDTAERARKVVDERPLNGVMASEVEMAVRRAIVPLLLMPGSPVPKHPGRRVAVKYSTP